jgi:hypothetical protein
MTTSTKINYKVEVKLSSITSEITGTGFSISKLRGIETIYVSLDSDFEITPETMDEFIELVCRQLPLQVIFFEEFWGRDYKMWIQSYTPCT